MSRYAKETSVSVERSRAELETVLSRYGADEFGYATRKGCAVVVFTFKGRAIRLTVPLPDRMSDEFWKTPARKYRRSEDSAHAAWEQACRQRWRALVLVVKAKLEAVDVEILTFDQAFLPHLVLPSGQTFGEWAEPQIEGLPEGRMPLLLPDFGEAGP